MRTLIELRNEAYDKAETCYQQFYNKHHERIRPFGDFDEAYVVRWGRTWLMLVLIDMTNEYHDDGGPSVDEMLDDAFNADFDRVLEGMYG